MDTTTNDSTQFTSLLITSFHPFPTLSLLLPSELPISCLSTILDPICPPSCQSLSFSSGKLLPPAEEPLSVLISRHGDRHEALFSQTADPLPSSRCQVQPHHPISIRLAVKLLGGKGGFASQLRAQGGRMSSNKATNNDSCRDLNGRRMSTIKEAQKLAAYIQNEPNRKAAATQAAQAKLDSLNAEIERLDSSTSAGGSKRRLDDHEFVEKSREMVEGVRDAVKEAMMKRRKKSKLNGTIAAPTQEDTDKITTSIEPEETADPLSGPSSLEKEIESESVTADEEKENLAAAVPKEVETPLETSKDVKVADTNAAHSKGTKRRAPAKGKGKA